MFNKNALANSLAAVTAVVYVVFYVLWAAAPEVFRFVFNAQFFGADISKSIPRTFLMTDFIGILAAVVVTAWIVGYLWGWFYNRFSKK